ncbi:type I iterative polyketide synthase [Penicillium citrinum]|uniref:Type I iterative polyketide synthase n=1 Tax=Penicillium citrinum TaxID=5077 RepID=A0A9W9TCK4_PENCI|nr:type I iterative polyketide synthase [Penicillium citrinum]KAJ5217474.1 type I iterative polyketide synthase [Penicillium citrinum]
MDTLPSVDSVVQTPESDIEHSVITPDSEHHQVNGKLHSNTPEMLSPKNFLVNPNSGSDRTPSQPGIVAITGMGMKLPGGVRTAEELWDFLVQKRNGHSNIPVSRYNMSAHHSATRPDFVRTAGGYFLQDDPAKFDADFFHLRPQLVAGLDPQQRLLAEVVWECIENAGETDLAGKNVGCFVGAFGNDWMEMAVHDREDHDRNHVACNHDFAVANQISRLFDFRGPSVMYRTACSSSMTALHHACQAVESDECEMAVVAGVNLILTPTTSTSISAYGALSPDGLCKTFDESADGYGRGEGVNAILIKKLDLALLKEDPIRAVIRATAINSDGNSPHAGIDDFSKTGFFECHGTGTQKGDVIETSVIAKVFDKGILMGSTKPNMGHSEGASGLTSVIKAVLALEHRSIPPNIHLKHPNPRIPFEKAGLKVPLELTPWPEGCAERVSVNCFGVGGSNAHVIIDSASSFCGERPYVNGVRTSNEYKLLAISTSSEDSLNRRETQIREYLEQNPGALQDASYTLGSRRDHLRFRSYLIANGESMIPARHASIPLTSDSCSREVTFVFSGQGAQWPAMGKELLIHLEFFRNDIKQMDDALQSLEDSPSWRIEDVLVDTDDSWIEDAEFAQPLCTAVQIGLVNLLRHWGVRPNSVAGHSSGEIAAAHAAGAIDLQTAIMLSYYRGRAAKLQTEPGGMVAVDMSKADVLTYLPNGVTVACENSPKNVTLSGEPDKLDQVMQILASSCPDCLFKRLPVGVAYHSDAMLKSARQYSKMISPYLNPSESMLPFFSCVKGQQISSPKELDTTYWRQTIQSPVLFHQSINALLETSQNDRVILEVGPHSLLSGPLRQIFEASGRTSQLVYIPTLLKDKSPMECLFSTIGQLHQGGVPLDFVAINGKGKHLTDLPLYPWKHEKRHWYETRISREWRHAKFPAHPLLGSRSPESSALEPSWRNRLQVRHVSWLMDHKIENDIVFPCVGYISMVGEGIRQLTGSTDFSIRELSMKAALNLKEKGHTEIVTNIRPRKLTDSTDSTWYDFTISAWDGTSWLKHCSGQAKAGKDDKWNSYQGIIDTIGEVRGVRDVQSNMWFDSLEGLGLVLGPCFRKLDDITVDPTRYYATAKVDMTDPTANEEGNRIHPTVIDQGLQLLGVASCNGLSRRMPNIGIPVSIESIYISEATDILSLQASFLKSEAGTLRSAMGGSITGRSSGRLAFVLEGVKFLSLNKPMPVTGAKIPLGSRLEWKPDIDLLAGTDYLFKSMERTPYMEVVAKLMIVAIVDFVDRLGMSTTNSPSSARKSQSWVKENSSRLQDVLLGVFPDLVEGISDPISLYSRFIRELEGLAESSEPWIQPIRGYLTKVLDAIDDQDSFTELFIDDRGFKSLYEFTATKVDLGYTFSLLGHANPSMAILEINPSTCGTTSGMLTALQSEEGTRLFSTYTLASQSSDLLTEANEQFRNVEGFSSALLDPEVEFSEHDFTPESYDLIIIPSNLPTTFKSKSLMQQVRSLLTPQGRVLVREVTPPVPFIDYFMGMIPAPFNLPDVLQLPSSFSSDFWEAELLAAGFIQPEHHSGTMSAYPWSMKQAILAKNLQKQPTKDLIYLLCHTESQSWAEKIRTKFESEGYKVHMATLENLPTEQPSSGKWNFISLLDLSGPFLGDMSAEDYKSLLNYMANKGRTLWVTKPSQMQCDDPSSGLITGFARTARLEALAEFVTFEVDRFNDSAVDALVKVYQKVRRESLQNRWDPECEFVLRDGVVHTGRFHWLSMEKLTPAIEKEELPMALAVERPGSVDSISWKQSRLSTLGDDDVELDVHYAGLNFRDIMVTLGVIDGERGLGLEASGVIRQVGPGVTHLRPGDRAIALGTGLYTSRLVTSSRLCFPVADDMSMKDAATIPVAYATAIYSLLTVGQLERSQSVLIHSACGAVGQAAIHIARMMKAEYRKIYATVGTPQKVEYLENMFGIPRKNIFNSRNTSFVTDVMNATEGRGVDIVLNSLAGELLHASWDCVAKFGKMVEIGKRDILGHGTMKMQPFGGNRTFVGVDLLQVMLDSPERFQRLGDMFTRLGLRGKIHPIRPVKVFDSSNTREAFAYMQRGTHMGKLLIQFTGENSVVNIPKTIFTASTVSFRSDAAYLIVGGLGGIGRAVANWLVENGARHLVFLSRSGVRSPGDQAFFRELQSQGCQPVAIAGSVTNMDDVMRAVTASPFPITGLIHLGMVLKPAPMLETNYDDWVKVQDPKVKGAWNLHRALESTKLDFFVVMSSIAALCGSIGQASYASANSYLDSLVRYRRSRGLPAATLNLGAVGDIGCFTQEPKWLAHARQWDFQVLNEGQAIEALKCTIIASEAPYDKDGISASGQLIVGMATTRIDSNVMLRIPWRDARYRIFANIGLQGQSAFGEESIFDMTKRHLIEAQQNPALFEQPRLYELILECIAHQMNFKVRNEAERTQFAKTSIDSIVIIEIVGQFRRILGIEISLSSLAGATNIGEIARIILDEIRQRIKQTKDLRER